MYLVHHEEDLIAAALWIRVGDHVWYSYGASTTQTATARLECSPEAHDPGRAEHHATVYDLRGITDTLNAADPTVALLQFKVGTGGQAVEYVGEWTFPISIHSMPRSSSISSLRRGG